MTGRILDIAGSGVQRLDPERAHEVTLRSLATLWKTPPGRLLVRRNAPQPDERLRVRLWNLPFPNPLGIAAGVDKNGIALEPLMALGFGFAELGTTTLLPQEGNPKPRIWRLRDEHAIINAMGFPNAGAAALRNNIVGKRPGGIVGINIGKLKDTPPDRAPEEYADLVRALFDVAQYITINVSSPNTPGLRDLQSTEHLTAIMQAVNEANQETARIIRRRPRPVLVKIAPDLSDNEIESLAGAAVRAGVSGIIATNTTTSREGLTERYREFPGGLSGPPLRERANQVMRLLYGAVGGQVPLIGVGGISSAADALERIRSGASAVQLYTALVYGGATLPSRIIRGMRADADREGWKSIRELVGIDARN